MELKSRKPAEQDWQEVSEEKSQVRQGDVQGSQSKLVVLAKVPAGQLELVTQVRLVKKKPS